jgi:hypothetical protein
MSDPAGRRRPRVKIAWAPPCVTHGPGGRGLTVPLYRLMEWMYPSREPTASSSTGTTGEIRMSRRTVLVAAVLAALGLSSGVVSAQVGADHEVTVGSDDLYFSHNKQNEPGLAVNPVSPSVLVAGAYDNIDMERCNAGDPKTCPFTPGVVVSGVQFSFDGGGIVAAHLHRPLGAQRLVPPDTTGGDDPGLRADLRSDRDAAVVLEAGLVSNGKPETRSVAVTAERRDADEAEDREESGEVPEAPSSAIRPGPNKDCPQETPISFGNSSIYGIMVADTN